MDKRTRILQHLYGEEPPERIGSLLAEDDALRREYQALSEVKHYLDHRPRPRPKAAVLDAVFAEAAQGAAPRGGRRDRLPIPGARLLRLRASGVVSALLVLFVAGAVGLGFFADREVPEASSAVAAHADAQSAPATAPEELVAEAEVDPAPPPPPAPIPESASLPPTVSVQSAAVLVADGVGTEAIEAEAAVGEAPPDAPPTAANRARRPTPVALDWDESGDLLEVHRQFRLVQARSGAAPPRAVPPAADDWRSSGSEESSERTDPDDEDPK